MVDAWGLPSFFYADCRRAFSLEMDGDQCHGAAAEVVCNGCVLQDASIACSAHFRKRIQASTTSMRVASLATASTVSYVMRCSIVALCMHTSSFGKRLLTWTCVAAEVIAYIPAVCDQASQDFIVPTDPQRLALFNLVTKKQMHACIENMCLGDNHKCRHGFPHAVQPSHAPVYHSTSNCCLYYRPRHEDRNVVPCHPVILLL